MKKLAAALAVLLCISLFGGCAEKKNDSYSLEITGTVTKDEKYSAAIVSFTPEDFEKAGFQLGDSCDIAFENGFCITDVPYYNGYYVKNNAPVIVSFPGFPNIIITYNNKGIWDDAKLTDQEKVTIRLADAGKYSAVQDALGQVYSNAYADYDSIEQFCNFRALSGGDLKEGFLYRGTTPVDSSRNRAPYTDQLLEEHGIAYVVDLADSEENMEEYLAQEDFNSPYAAELYKHGQIVFLDMNTSYQTEEYQQKVATGMKQMLNASGPVYIHCTEGKDRTGFVSMLLEALGGATYEEMRSDYMITYDNYFSVSYEETPERYAAVAELYFDPFVAYLHGTDNIDELRKADYVQDAANYLISGGMTEAEIEQLREFITK